MKIKNRYRFSPQLKVYDKLKLSWTPYVMFKQDKNITNNFVNTDGYGFRYTDNLNEKKYTLNTKKKTNNIS